MNIRTLGLLLVLATSLGACATSYQNHGFTGGFRDTQLAPDVFRISFHGNAFTSTDRVQDFALLRAADLCLSNGFKYFVVINSADQTKTITQIQPGSSQTTGTVSAYGDSASFNSTTTYNPTTINHIHKPGVGLMVRGLTEKPESGMAFDAAFLSRSLREKYQLQ